MTISAGNKPGAALLLLVLIISLSSCSEPAAPTATATNLPSEATATNTVIAPTAANPVAATLAPTATAAATVVSVAATVGPTPAGLVENNLTSGWQTWRNANYVNEVVSVDGDLWAATGAGLLRWNPATNNYSQTTANEGLLATESTSIVLCDLGEPSVYVGSGFGISQFVFATEEWRYWTTETTGMRSNQVTTLACDDAGDTLFIGYRNHGLDRFNRSANNWREFSRQSGDLENNHVTGLKIIPAAASLEIWVISGYGGVTVLAENAIQWNDDTGLPSERIYDLDHDRQGNVWLATNRGLVRGNSQGNWIAYDRDSVPSMPSNRLFAVTLADDGIVWTLADNGRLCRFDPFANLCSDIYEASPGMLAGGTGLIFDPAGQLISYDSQGSGMAIGQPDNWNAFTIATPLGTNIIHDIVEDSNGYIWLGTEQGAYRLNGADDSASWVHFTRENSGLTHDQIHAMAADEQGGIWFGSYGASYYDGSVWINLTKQDGLLDSEIEAISFDGDGRVWFATRIGISIWDGSSFITINEAAGLPEQNITDLLWDDGTMWAATWGGGVLRFEGESWTVLNRDNSDLPDNNVRTLASDQENDTILIGTRQLLLALSADSMTVIPEVATQWISDIVVGSEGQIFVATADRGVYYRDGNNDWQLLNESNGLPSQTIEALFIDNLGTIWFGGHETLHYGGGLARWVPES